MIELDFVEDTLRDRWKDYKTKSYHISMVEKVIKGFKYDEFIIEFQNDSRPISYFATFPLQRDFIVEMINFAILQYKASLNNIKSINCPDNHNVKEDRKLPIDIDKHLKPKLALKFILQDFVLPPPGIKRGKAMKARKTMGFAERYLLLGHSQLLIARDSNFDNITGLIPLEGGFCMIKKPRDFGGLLIESTFRQY
jgi:hypothetical protein